MPMPCSIWLMSWLRPAAFAEAQAAATQALDLYQRKGNLPGTRESLGYLDPVRTYLREDLPMPHSAVPRIELNEDDTINLDDQRRWFREGTPIEISGQVTQDNGAVATFYSVQECPVDAGSNRNPDGAVYISGPSRRYSWQNFPSR